MSFTNHDAEQLRRAIALARRGQFQVEPNPPVGCVIEHAEAGIVGESWHGAYGGPHAEIGALRIAGDAAQGATAYISLAPCGVHGKTPPCADALIEAGVARVVFAVGDPNPLEQSAGVQRLEAAGIEVIEAAGSLAAEGEQLLHRFRGALERDRPWVVLKWAMSLDGRIAAHRGTGGAITGAQAHRLVHDWRAHCDAVAVGIETVLTDDPRLTCRLSDGMPDGLEQPLRIVFDARLRTPVSSRLVRSVDEVGVMIFTARGADAFRREALEETGCVVYEVDASPDGRLDLAQALRRLHDDGVRRLVVEGGARIHGSFLRDGLVDQVSAFVAPAVLGGADAVPAVEDTGITSMDQALHLHEVAWRTLGEDVLMQGYVRNES